MILTIPTIGFNCETLGIEGEPKLDVWDIGGLDKIRCLWWHYFEGSKGLIFVISLAEPQRFPEAKEELDKLLKNDKELKDLPVLIFANKSDINKESITIA